LGVGLAGVHRWPLFERKGGQTVTAKPYQVEDVGRGRVAATADVPAFSIGGIPPQNSLLHSVIKLRKALVDAIDKGKEKVLVEVYPCGVELTTGKGLSNKAPVDCVRGLITSFSDDAKRRLKKAFLELWMPGGELRAVTLTTHKKMGRVEFQPCVDRFTRAIEYRGWAAIMRKEKQIRGALHGHLALWTPAGVSSDEIKALWLKATGETKDKAAQKYAVMIRTLTPDEPGWLIYMGKHDAKDDVGQEMSEGKHWGILNRKAFTKRCPDRFTLSVKQHSQFLRMLRRHQQALRRSDVQRLFKNYVDALGVSASARFQEEMHVFPVSPGLFNLADSSGRIIGRSLPIKDSSLVEKAAWLRLKRNRVKRLPRGDILRLVPGHVCSRIAQFILHEN
jgi:hypothetical protein